MSTKATRNFLGTAIIIFAVYSAFSVANIVVAGEDSIPVGMTVMLAISVALTPFALAKMTRRAVTFVGFMAFTGLVAAATLAVDGWRTTPEFAMISSQVVFAGVLATLMLAVSTVRTTRSARM